MSNFKNMSISLLLILLSFYIFICVSLYIFQDNFIFFPVKLNESFSYLKAYKKYEITITHNKVNLHGWLLNPGSSNLIIYYGGNAEEVSGNLNEFEALGDFSILLLNYRGYGKSEGSPGQEQLFSDALYVYDHILKNSKQKIKKIYVLGRSLGTAIGLYLASKRPVDGAILVTPFASIKDLAQNQFPYLPVKLLLKHPFNSIELVNNLDIPTLVLIAEKDEIIPFKSTSKLIDKLGANSRSVTIKNAKHNDIQLFSLYWEKIKNYLKN